MNRESYTYQYADPILYPILKEHARHMRLNPTDAEAFLWKQLQGGYLGQSFRRQHIIGDNIADFVCLSSRLVIEVDGKYHDSIHQQYHDALRTEELERQGFTVLRLTNEMVLTDIETALTLIKQNL